MARRMWRQSVTNTWRMQWLTRPCQPSYNHTHVVIYIYAYPAQKNRYCFSFLLEYVQDTAASASDAPTEETEDKVSLGTHWIIKQAQTLRICKLGGWLHWWPLPRGGACSCAHEFYVESIFRVLLLLGDMCEHMYFVGRSMLRWRCPSRRWKLQSRFWVGQESFNSKYWHGWIIHSYSSWRSVLAMLARILKPVALSLFMMHLWKKGVRLWRTAVGICLLIFDHVWSRNCVFVGLTCLCNIHGCIFL